MDWYSMSDVAIGRELAARLKQVRLTKNISQQELAKKTGIHRVTLSRIESGQKMSLQTFIHLMRGLEILENLDALVPEVPPSPLDLARLKGNTRQRASRQQGKEDEEPYNAW